MDLNNLIAGVTVPGWAVAAGGLAVVLLLILVLRPRSEGGGVAVVAQLAVVALIGGAAYFGLKYFEDNSRFSERRAIEDRAATLLSQANQPGSVLGCLNAAAGPVLDEACEKMIFAEPQRIASAIGVTADRVALLYDATLYAARDAAFLERFEHLRKSLEADPFGLVAHVFATEHKCIPDSCTRFRILKDIDKVKSNLTSRKFDGLLAKYKETWVSIRPGINFGEMNAMPPVNTIGGKVNEKELPSANTAVQMNAPSGMTATGPMIVPPSPNQAQQPAHQAPTAASNEQPAATPASLPQQEQTPPPANNAKQKQQKQQPAATQQKQSPQQPQAKRKGGPPEPVGGLPRVTARGNNPPADDDDDDTPTASPAPPPQQEPQSVFPNIFRRN
jgi:hypothetical protein